MEEKKVNFIMAIHCHQPVGNFGWVFEEAYKMSYRPFIDVLEQHPKIKMSIHYSGCLWDWIIKHHPEFITRLKNMVKSGQVEIMSGGYYEPILPLLPDVDKIGQIKMLNDFIARDFGTQPKGGWLAERVWEPYLPKYFHKTALSYTIVDDSHFKLAGLKEEEIFGYYVTEDDGQKLFIFPTLEKLRYLTPFKLPEESINYLKSVASDIDRAVVIADDGEKFGLWPGTHQWVYKEKWLDNFFKALEDNLSWINITTFSEFIKDNAPLGRVYIPCASYKEMIEWSGGFFRNFLVKYHQTNIMQKKMLYVSDKVNNISEKEHSLKKKEARHYLYQGQCNCSYWHGVFGGLYLFHLRSSVFENLITAEHIADELEHKGAWIKHDIFDINRDGWDEILVNNKAINAYFDLKCGGSIFELDVKSPAANLANVITRIPESYHKNLKEKQVVKIDASASAGTKTIHEIVGVKEDNLGDFLHYDWYNRQSLMDHFLGERVTLHDFYKCQYEELGDFVTEPYDYKVKKSKDSLQVILERKGHIWGNNPKPIKITKAVNFDNKSPELDAAYEIDNLSGDEISLWFGVEFNFSVKPKHMAHIGEIKDISEISLSDDWHHLDIKYVFNKKTSVWHFPIETISESETGIEKTHQGLCLLFNWKIKLAAGGKWQLKFSTNIKKHEA